MATLTAACTLTSTDLTSDSMSVAISNAITVTHTTGLSRRPVPNTSSTPASDLLIYTADDFAATAYVYVKNCDSVATDYIYIYDDTSTGDPVILKLSGGEWAFLPTNADKTLKAYAATAGTVLEFAVFGADQ
jgi:hypothetical protein